GGRPRPSARPSGAGSAGRCAPRHPSAVVEHDIDGDDHELPANAGANPQRGCRDAHPSRAVLRHRWGPTVSTMTRRLHDRLKRESRVGAGADHRLSLTPGRKTTYSAAFVGAEEPCKPLSFG